MEGATLKRNKPLQFLPSQVRSLQETHKPGSAGGSPRSFPSPGKRHRSSGRTQPHYDPPAHSGSRFPTRLPKPARHPAAQPRPGHSAREPRALPRDSPESAAGPRGGQAVPAPAAAPLTSQPRPPHLPAGPRPPPQRAGLGRAGKSWVEQRPAALTGFQYPHGHLCAPTRASNPRAPTDTATPTEPPPARAITGRERGPDPGWGWRRPPEVERRRAGGRRRWRVARCALAEGRGVTSPRVKPRLPARLPLRGGTGGASRQPGAAPRARGGVLLPPAAAAGPAPALGSPPSLPLSLAGAAGSAHSTGPPVT